MLVNNILGFNAAENIVGGSDGGGLCVQGADPTVRFNDLYGNLPNNVGCQRTDSHYVGLYGNVSVDPAFVSRAPGTRNLHLRPSSPMIDIGDDTEAPALDLDGAPRVLDGNNDQVARIDLGAFEAGDLDGDGTPDWQDSDDDGDGVPDTQDSRRGRGA